MRNKFSTSLTLIALSLTCAATNVPSKDTATEAVVIRDYFSDSRQSGTVVPLLPKEKRLSSSASNIQIYYDELIPDTIKTAVAVAADIWESALKISVPVTVSFELAPLTTGCDTEVLVRYLEAGEDSWPCALYFNTECEKGADSYPIFATIRINDGTKWDAGFS